MCGDIIYILVGLLVGFIGGFAGIGGAPFMVAFLVLVCNMTQLYAQANVLSVMLGPMSLLGTMSLWDNIKPQLKHIAIGTICYAIFSYFGAYLAFYFGESNVRIYFALLLIIIAGIQLGPTILRRVSGRKQLAQEIDYIPITWIIIIGAIVGVLGGLFGIGAGVLMVPLFVSLFHMKKNNARALSLAILLPPVSAGGFIKYYQEGLVDFKLVGILFISYFIANYFGAKLGNKVSTERFKVIYAFLLIAIAIIYFTI